MLYDAFCLEMTKLANPNILRYIDTYRPDAALSAIHREFGLLLGYLKKEGIDPTVKKSIQRRIDDLNRTEFLLKAYKKSYEKFGRSRKADEHLRMGFQDSIKESTESVKKSLDEMVLSGRISQQDAQIALKRKAGETIPSGLTKEYVENLDKNLGEGKPDERYLQKILDRQVLSASVRPGFFEADEKILKPFEQIKEANVRMHPVTGSSGRNKSGLAISKKIMPIKSVSRPIVTKKLHKQLELKAKKVPGSLAEVGISNPKYLGKQASALPGLKLLSSAKSRKKVMKPSKNLIGRVKFSFKKPKLLAPPKTKVTQYLKKRGF